MFILFSFPHLIYILYHISGVLSTDLEEYFLKNILFKNIPFLTLYIYYTTVGAIAQVVRYMYIVYMRLWSLFPIWKRVGELENFGSFGKGWRCLVVFGVFGKNTQKRCNHWVVEALRLLRYSLIGKYWRPWKILGYMGNFGRAGKIWERWEDLVGVGEVADVYSRRSRRPKKRIEYPLLF